MKSRHHLTLSDLMATVVAAALAMGVFAWGGIPRRMPAALVELYWVSVPVVGILWDRWRGGRGIFGGALAGAAAAGVPLIWVVINDGQVLRHPARLYLAIHPGVVILLFAGPVAIGSLIGVATWLVAAGLGQSVASQTPSHHDQVVREG